MELGGQGDKAPDLDTEYYASDVIVEAFFALRSFCPEVEGFSPITPSLVLDWQSVTGGFISAAEFDIITAMDTAYKKGMADVAAYFEKRNK